MAFHQQISIYFYKEGEGLLKTISSTELSSFQWTFHFLLSVWKGFCLFVCFTSERSAACVLPMQYAFSTLWFVHQLTCLSCLLEMAYLMVVELTRAVVGGVWTNSCLGCGWQWRAEGAVYADRAGVRQSLLWRIKWSLQRGFLFPCYIQDS